jgi:hypothetical protein
MNHASGAAYMDGLIQAFKKASIKTSSDLRTVAALPHISQLSQLPLPEIERISNEVARVVPAGNIPGIVLSGLARLEGRAVPASEANKHLGALFRGVRQLLDKTVYGAFFAGPAAVLYGYQQLLRLAGKDINEAFPDGTWQFYLEFALREDSAHHTNETLGFHQKIVQYRLTVSEADMLACWIMTSAFFLRQLPRFLANEWGERVALRLLEDITEKRDLYKQWEVARPFQRGADAGQRDYPTYRRAQFDEFITPIINKLKAKQKQAYLEQMDEAEKTRLPAYQRQMTWLSYLEPDVHQERRCSYTLEEAQIGIIWKDHYYLLPLASLTDVAQARAAAQAILRTVSNQPPAALDDVLANTRRSEHQALRKLLDESSQRDIEALRRATILINWDNRDSQQPLMLLRQGKRGIGDHPLTIFRTENSIVFDQSHIFFDGIWGAAVAEMMTNEALSWASYFAQVPAPRAAAKPPYSPILAAPAALKTKAKAASLPVETGAENIMVKLNALMNLRNLLKQRSDLVQIKVNDLLLLYCGLHAFHYTSSQALQERVTKLANDKRPAARDAHRMITEEWTRIKSRNPAMLIPIDASRYDPRERVFPTTFRNPLTDFAQVHSDTLAALQAYRASAKGNRSAEFKLFYDRQVTYLRMMAGFGELLARYREVALRGESTSTATIRFLGKLPPMLQTLLNAIPSQFDVLNEIIKGEEVFSNIGRVAAGSTLNRFITAKDDNNQKMLAWGILTDDRGMMHLSLRDFRPHVAALAHLNLADLAQQIAQDYLDAYAQGLNQYMTELREIVVASRDTLTSN